MRTMCLSGSNHSNLHVQAALPAVTDVTKESDSFIIVYCFFTVGSVNLFAIINCDLCWGGIDSVSFVKEECEKTLRTTGLTVSIP